MAGLRELPESGGGFTETKIMIYTVNCWDSLFYFISYLQNDGGGGAREIK